MQMSTRLRILLCVLSLTGVSPMPAAALDPPKPFDTRVTFEQIDPATGKVEWSAADVDAFYKGGKWHVRAGRDAVKLKPAVGSRITDGENAVWSVTKVESVTVGSPNARYILTATKLPAGKKP